MKKLLISILVLSVLFNYTTPVFAFTGGFITNPKILDSIQTENIV